jgi:DNA-binding transcriptional MerR regulator
VEIKLRGIGEMARASGLTVSALRFYDRVGVLVPAVVDPHTGYRRYADSQLPAARLVARLRRVGMPLVDIVEVLRLWPDRAARVLLDAHLRRLEDGLADARNEISRVHALLDREENPMTRLTVRGADFAAAIDAVRFAMSRDPELPMLGGVLLAADPPAGALQLVATDRYRLAVAEAPAALDGSGFGVIAPAWLVDDIRALPAGADGDVVLTVDAAGITVECAGRIVSGPPLDHDFPDVARVLRRGSPASPLRVDVGALRGELATRGVRRVLREHDGVQTDVSVLGVGADGAVAVLDPDASEGVGVNREFLLEALAAAGRDQLVLELDGPIRPLAIRRPDDDATFSILMPTRLAPTG